MPVKNYQRDDVVSRTSAHYRSSVKMYGKAIKIIFECPLCLLEFLGVPSLLKYHDAISDETYNKSKKNILPQKLPTEIKRKK